MERLVLAVLLAVTTPNTPTVDEIVTRHVAAIGGVDAIHRIRSFVVHGWYHEGTFSIRTYTAQMRPFYRVIGDPLEGLKTIHEGYDGSAWEYYPDPGVVIRTIGAAASTTRHSAAFDDVLVDYHRYGTFLTYGGRTHIDGKNVYVLNVTLADGFREDVYVDTGTYMIDGMQRIVPMHAFGQRYVTHDLFADYRPEGDVMMPHRDAEIDSVSGKVLDDGTVDSVEINPTLQMAMFSPPEWSRTPLQTMIQRIYDERDEASAVLATYRDFRRSMDLRDLSTADAVDFIGYQCLKMGHTDTAVQLLSANVADYPNSARAHFGLGRALQVSGNKALAAAQYRKALSIDASFSRARDALNALK